MTTPTDDQVVVNHYAERGGCLDNVLGHRDIRSGRGRIAGRMIMYEDQRRSSHVEGAFYYLPGINWRVIDCPPLLPLILDQRILAIKKENMKLLDLAVCDLGAAIVDQFVP